MMQWYKEPILIYPYKKAIQSSSEVNDCFSPYRHRELNPDCHKITLDSYHNEKVHN